MKTFDLLRPLVEERGGVLLDSEDRELLVLDRFARGVLPLPRSLESPLQIDTVLSLVDRLYTRAQELASRKPRFTVHATIEDICDSEEIRSGLGWLLTYLTQATNCELVIHFSRPAEQWVPFLRWLYAAVGRCKTLRDHVILYGPFNLLDETVQEVFFGLGVRLGFVVGWWSGSDPRDANRIRSEVLRELAQYGFRIPVVCYVHADNIGLAQSLIEESLALNEHSGFSLPLVFHHPHYSFMDGQPELPEPADYCRLLKQIYQEIPYYDDVFFPVNELAWLVGHGGWCPESGVPAIVNLLTKPGKGVGFFRQIPAFARSWVGWIELRNVAGESVVSWLLDRHQSAFRWETNPFCKRCCWRYVCGGVDAWDVCSESAVSVLETACAYRKEFLEVFAHDKARLLLADMQMR